MKWKGWYSNMPNESEQWLLNGECNKCRRQSYCSKSCTRSKRKTEAMVKSFVASQFNEMTGGAYGEIIKHGMY